MKVFQPGLEEKVQFLSRPASYPDRTESVETKQTHMSWVFITDTHAWKLKKPVRLDHIDFSTPEVRRRDCEEEIRLNRRLAPGVYQAVVPLTLGPKRLLQVNRLGLPIDWLVRMRRLPEDRMLDRLIASGGLRDEDLQKAGTLLANFYLNAATDPMPGSRYRERLTAELKASGVELTQAEAVLPADLATSVIGTALEFVEYNPELFDARAEAGKIIEGHGDLRPEHICLEEQPLIIDCLEFSRDLRILDPASELSFLGLECERLGSSRAGQLILSTYLQQSGDDPPERLMCFYRTYHACIRARLAILHLKDHEDVGKWTARAQQYLELAA